MTNSFGVSSALPNEKEVVDFLKPHFDTLRETGPHPSIPGHRLCTLEGKPRPMLILRCFPKRERGLRWFLVVPLTSKGEDTVGDLQPIGNCIDEGVDSFVELIPCKLPENMICRNGVGQLTRHTPCDPPSFAHAVKVILHKAQKFKD